MAFIENPKTLESGIVCCIPQKGACPNGCPECFFQSGRGYLEPLDKNTPNMPDLDTVRNRIVRVNDGNDSNNDRELVLESTKQYPHKFYNTSLPDLDFPAPVVLTVNPGKWVETMWYKITDPPKNLMFVRVLTNMWNLKLVWEVIHHYTTQYGFPVVLTFMAYHDINTIPEEYRESYELRLRTINPYYAIKNSQWRSILSLWENNPLVYSCGTEGGSSLCKYCGNCVREYHNTLERMKTPPIDNPIKVDAKWIESDTPTHIPADPVIDTHVINTIEEDEDTSEFLPEEDVTLLEDIPI